MSFQHRFISLGFSVLCITGLFLALFAGYWFLGTGVDAQLDHIYRATGLFADKAHEAVVVYSLPHAILDFQSNLLRLCLMPITFVLGIALVAQVLMSFRTSIASRRRILAIPVTLFISPAAACVTFVIVRYLAVISFEWLAIEAYDTIEIPKEWGVGSILVCIVIVVNWVLGFLCNFLWSVSTLLFILIIGLMQAALGYCGLEPHIARAIAIAAIPCVLVGLESLSEEKPSFPAETVATAIGKISLVIFVPALLAGAWQVGIINVAAILLSLWVFIFTSKAACGPPPVES